MKIRYSENDQKDAHIINLIVLKFFSEYAPAGKNRHLEYVRLVNMVHIGKFEKDYIWEIVKTARKSFLLDYEPIVCYDTVHLSDVNIKHLVDSIQNQLDTNVTSIPLDNVAAETLEATAEMFVYLSYCPPQGSVRKLNY